MPNSLFPDRGDGTAPQQRVQQAEREPRRRDEGDPEVAGVVHEPRGALPEDTRGCEAAEGAVHPHA